MEDMADMDLNASYKRNPMTEALSTQTGVLTAVPESLVATAASQDLNGPGYLGQFNGALLETVASSSEGSHKTLLTQTGVLTAGPEPPVATASSQDVNGPGYLGQFNGALLETSANSSEGSHKKTSKAKRQKVSSASGPSPRRRAKDCARCISHHKPCLEDCIFAPLFRANQQAEYEKVVDRFGVRCVEILLKRVDTHEDRLQVRQSLLFAAEAWTSDPRRGTFGIVEALQATISSLEQQLASATQALASQQQQQQGPAADESADQA